MTPYPPPLDQLLTFGDAWRKIPWPDYVVQFGLTSAHIPDLIRMATDQTLLDETVSDLCWAPGHAWRALAQLGAVEAAAPLTGQLYRIDVYDDDFMGEDLPIALGMLGEPAFPVLEAYLANPKQKFYARVAITSSFAKAGEHNPAVRSAAAAVLARQLAHYGQHTPTLNAFLITALVNLQAVEHAALIERVFTANKADITIMGDWEEVQIELGLLQERVTPRPNYGALYGFPDLTDLTAKVKASVPPVPAPIQQWNAQVEAKAQAKAARAEEKRARKRKR